MPLPRHFFAPSFRHRHLGAFLATIVGTMVYVAVFVTAAEASLATVTLAWNKDVSSRLTVEIPAAGDETATPQAERIKQATSILRAMPDIASVTPIKESEAARLLQPWIDDAELLKSLPVPSLIDVTVKTGSTLSADDVRQQLKTTLRDVRVDDHAAWMADLARFVNGLVVFGGVMIALTFLTLILAVSLLCRTVIATERDTIGLLHIMGADDADIARHFESHARRLALPAAGLGFVLAIISAAGLLYFMRHFANPLTLQQAHWVMLGAAVALVPLLAVWVASLSARLSSLNYLRTMP